jgi:alpha-mannosidase
VKIVALLNEDGREPNEKLGEQDALGAWCAVSAGWYPAFLAGTSELPKLEDVSQPASPLPEELRIVAVGARQAIPSGYETQAADAGTILLESGTDRPSLIRAIAERLDLSEVGGAEERQGADPIVLDFLALGTLRWWLRDLATAMGHSDAIDEENLTREVLAGAAAWQQGDHPTATNRLRAAFEILTQARERFYPVDAFLVDLCLLDTSTPAADLAEVIAARVPLTLLGPARAIEILGQQDRELIQAISAIINDSTIDVVGGAYEELDEPLRPLASIDWQLRHGSEVYRKYLDGRTTETIARRRFGLYPQLPQIAKRFGFRFAVYMGFDSGRFPVRTESKRLWEAPDGSTLEALTRTPLGADRAVEGLRLPWRMARTMRDDHVATIVLAHWPKPVAPWYRDWRRAASYSPVLGRAVTLNDYFHLTDRPFEAFRPRIDDYETPYLAQAAARRDPQPISQRAEHARLRARFDALGAARALARAVGPEGTEPPPAEPSFPAVEAALETGRLEEARAGLDLLEPFWTRALVRGIVGEGSAGRPGYLVLNPLGVARRVSVLLSNADADLRPAGPLRAAQFTEDGVWAVVSVPAYGFAWIPSQSNVDQSVVEHGGLSVRGRVLRNEAIALEVDADSGGIRNLRAAGESSPRLGQQLVLTGLTGSGPSETIARPRAEAFEVDYAGPALVQAWTRGALLDPRDGRRLASFHQRYRLWTGRPTLDLTITLDDLDPEWRAAAAQGDPWQQSIACRWAWPDPNAMLRRTVLGAAELTSSERPETPDALDISTRRQRTALVFGGLAHHRRHGSRMLDTLLVAGSETCLTFQLGVALDLEYPFQAALDLVTPVFVVPTDVGPPRTGPTGWLFQLESRTAVVARVEYSEHTGAGTGWGLIFELMEIAGHATRCRLRTFRDPVWARQIDPQGEMVVDLTIDGDGVWIDLTPHEIMRVEVTLG